MNAFADSSTSAEGAMVVVVGAIVVLVVVGSSVVDVGGSVGPMETSFRIVVAVDVACPASLWAVIPLLHAAASPS